MATITPDLLQRFIAREPAAVRQVFDILLPIFMFRVTRVLDARGAKKNARMRAEVSDMIQNTWTALLKNECHLIRMWDPARGMSFENYAGLIAEQKAAETLRSRNGSLWLNGKAEAETMDRCVDSSRNPERLAHTRETLRMILKKVKSELSERGLLLFDLLIVQQRSIEDVCHVTGMSEDAVYAWKSRLERRMKEIAREISS